MNLKKILLAALILCMTAEIYSQKVQFSMTAGLGSYAMTDLRSVNEAVMPDFDSRLVTDFPPYWFFQPRLNLIWTKFNLGFEYTIQYTGSRISAKDYSGEFTYDMLIASDNVGLFFGWELIRKNRFRLAVEAHSGMAFTKLDVDYSFQLNNTIIEEYSSRSRVTNFYLQPGLSCDYFIFPQMSLGLSAGYYFDIGNPNFTIFNDEVGAQWRGYRIGLTMGYIF
jgi:hypothetical protein